MHTLSNAKLAELGREWLLDCADCYGLDTELVEEDLNEMSDERILKRVGRDWSGGLDSFEWIMNIDAHGSAS